MTNKLDQRVEEFKKVIGYTKLGSHPMPPTENSDVIVGALMVALHQTRQDLYEELKAMGVFEEEKYEETEEAKIFYQKLGHNTATRTIEEAIKGLIK